MSGAEKSLEAKALLAAQDHYLSFFGAPRVAFSDRRVEMRVGSLRTAVNQVAPRIDANYRIYRSMSPREIIELAQTRPGMNKNRYKNLIESRISPISEATIQELRKRQDPLVITYDALIKFADEHSSYWQELYEPSVVAARDLGLLVVHSQILRPIPKNPDAAQFPAA